MTMIGHRTIDKPARMARLPLDHRGFAVPWFVQWFTDDDKHEGCEFGRGVPDFRVADERKFARAMKERLCWLCGDKLGVHMAFVIGPMCAVNRVTSEPPCHLDCATYAAQVCPFLSRPRMRRNEHELPEQRVDPAGFFIERNPGVACIWVTRSYKPFRPHNGAPGVLIHLGAASSVLWFAEGRPATRAEVEASIDSGFPALKSVAEREGADAVAALAAGMKSIAPLLPATGEANHTPA
jgi:hypothetical protein